MSYPTYEEWFASLSQEDRAKTGELISKLRDLGADRPELWARAEVSAEASPQLVRFLILRKFWPLLIDGWSRDPDSWMGRMIEAAERNPKGHFADAGLAMKRMKACGVSVADIVSVLRMASFEAAFGVLDLFDEGCDLDAPPDFPTWCIMEADPDGNLTGRHITSLHESLLTMDPSGRDGGAG